MLLFFFFFSLRTRNEIKDTAKCCRDYIGTLEEDGEELEIRFSAITLKVV